MRIIYISLLCILLNSCVSQMGNPSIATTESTRMIEVGLTTKQEILLLYGEPSYQSVTAESEIWMYIFAQSEPHPLMYVPIIGLFVMASGEGISAESQSMMIIFDRQGTVQTLTHGGLTMGGG